MLQVHDSPAAPDEEDTTGAVDVKGGDDLRTEVGEGIGAELGVELEVGRGASVGPSGRAGVETGSGTRVTGRCGTAVRAEEGGAGAGH